MLTKLKLRDNDSVIKTVQNPFVQACLNNGFVFKVTEKGVWLIKKT